MERGQQFHDSYRRRIYCVVRFPFKDQHFSESWIPYLAVDVVASDKGVKFRYC